MLRCFAVALVVALAPPPAAGESLRQPQKLTVSLADDYLGSLSPDGKRLYFVSNRNATSQIWYQDLSAPASTLLFDEGADTTWPRVSPDGKRLLYVSFANEADGQLCVRDLPKLTRHCLAGGGALEATWASANELLLLARSPGAGSGDLELSRVRVDTRELEKKPIVTRNLNGPAIAPGGDWLAFVPLTRAATAVGPAFAAQAARALVLRSINGGSGGDVEVHLALPGGTSQPAFSSDGKWLYFTQFLNDTDQNGVLDGDDHGVLFRVAFDARDPAALNRAVPQQLTTAAWNCQYPAPSPQKLVLTCSRGESLDLYTLPLDGMVPSAWDRARIRDEAQAARDRWVRLLLLHRRSSTERDPTTHATLLLGTIRQHLLLSEYEAALYHIEALEQLKVPQLSSLAPLLKLLVAERRGLRSFDRGELGHRYLTEARTRLDAAKAIVPTEAPAVFLRHLLLSEIDDHLGDKSTAVDELKLAVVDAKTPGFLIDLMAARIEYVYRELDRDADELAALVRIIDHPLLPESERLRIGGIYTRALMRKLSVDGGAAAAARDLTQAAPGSARAFADALWPCLDLVTKPTIDRGRVCVKSLYDANPSLGRRRLLVAEVVRRAEDNDCDDLEYELVRRWVRDVPPDDAERYWAERLFRYTVQDYAYAAMDGGKYADAAADFDAVVQQAMSLESHLGYLEASIAAGKDVEALYRERYRPATPLGHFVRAYLDLRKLPELEGVAFDRAWQTASADVLAAESTLAQKCEVQALHGALLHLGFLRTGNRGQAEEANTHYLLALDLAHENARYRAMVLEELALLHASVGNFRIALEHFDARDKLPFADPRVALGHDLWRARSLLHIGREADAAKAAARGLALVDATPALTRFLPLALDRAALYALAAGDGKSAIAAYDRAGKTPAPTPPPNDKLRNPIVRALSRAASALAAGDPGKAIVDLDRVDAAFADPAQAKSVDWPDTPPADVRETYDLLRYGLRGQAERAMGRYENARKTLETRHQLLEARAKRRGYDDDLIALSTAEAQLAELMRFIGDTDRAAQLASQALAHADDFAHKSNTPLTDAQLSTLGFAAELHVVNHVPRKAFAFDLKQRLQETYDLLAKNRDPKRHDIRLRMGVYLTLLGLDRER
ncbi:MAG TPA: hypothetical protein VIA18_33185 [Polyangia bacterium]|nr:hypothetical protein [Polyangia bacterium]